MTYREGGRVKTKNKYLGPATGGDGSFGRGAPANLPIAMTPPPSSGLRIGKIRRLKPVSRATLRKRHSMQVFSDAARDLNKTIRDTKRETRWYSFLKKRRLTALKAERTFDRQAHKRIFKRSLRASKQ